MTNYYSLAFTNLQELQSKLNTNVGDNIILDCIVVVEYLLKSCIDNDTAENKGLVGLYLEIGNMGIDICINDEDIEYLTDINNLTTNVVKKIDRALEIVYNVADTVNDYRITKGLYTNTINIMFIE